MTLNDLIIELKEKHLQPASLEVACYYFINDLRDKLNSIDLTDFTGEVERISMYGYLQEYTTSDELERIKARVLKKSYKGLNIYHFLGLSLQDSLQDTDFFTVFLHDYYDNHSFNYKFLITLVFNEFESKLEKELQSKIDSNDDFIKTLKYIYLENSLNINGVLERFCKRKEDLGIIDLLLIEKLDNIKSIGYEKEQQQLLKDIIWCATEIQSKNKTLNNKEDQYNNLFHSLLRAKDYKTESQTQRGQSYTKTQYGELDIEIFSKDNLPLSIFEAFVIDTINKEYITIHLRKLSENYDSNGLKKNYAIVYSNNQKFDEFWERYRKFVLTINFKHPLISNSFEDITNKFPKFSGIRIGLTKHNSRGNILHIYHIFMDMYFR